MDNNDNNQSQPADQAAYAQWLDITTNRNNPKYAIFHNGGDFRNATIAKEAQALIDKAFPGNTTIGPDGHQIDNGLGVSEFDAAMNKEMEKLGITPPAGEPGKPGEQQQPTTDPAERMIELRMQADAQIAAKTLHDRYGDQAETLISDAQEMAAFFDSTNPQWQNLAMAAIKKFGQSSIIELLAGLKGNK